MCNNENDNENEAIKLHNRVILRNTGKIVAYDFEYKGMVKRMTRKDAFKYVPKVKGIAAVVVDDDVQSTFDNLVGTVVIDDIAELDNSNKYGNFKVGEVLAEFVLSSRKYNPRDAFYQFDKWIGNFTRDGCIGVLYGLRGTGKTVVLEQLADKYLSKDIRVAYATFSYKECEINEVINYVKKLANNGYRLILIDEITYTTGMLNRISALSDEIISKVIIAGTDSLLLHWATQDALFHRAYMAQTTSMSYAEYKRIKPDSNIDEFIEKGGILWEKSPMSVKEYITTSVVENIKHSIDMLEDWQHFTDRDYFENISSNELFNILWAICECAAYDAAVKNIKKNWGKAVAWKLTLAHEIVGGLKNSPEIKAIMDGLQDYYVRVPAGNFDPQTIDMAIKRLKSLNFLSVVKEMHEAGIWRDTLVITQPYIKRNFIRRTLSVSNMNQIIGIEDTIEKMESITSGIILEDIIYFEAEARYVKQDTDYVFKYRSENKEIDVVIYSRESGVLSLIEVKLSDKKVKSENGVHGQDRHLTDINFVGELVRYFSPKFVTKTVLYRGVTDNSADDNGVRWVNAEEWLLGKTEL